jgi:two-component system cell cycle sensor histidine kinase/response regulator CckA
MNDGKTPGSVRELAQLRQAVNASSDVIFMTDAAGVFTFVNPQFEHVYGYAARDVIGRLTPRVLKSGGSTPAHYSDMWAQLKRGETIVHEFANRSRDGSIVLVQATISPITDEGGTPVGFLAIQRDVTAFKHAHEALLKSRATLQLISDNVLDLVAQIRLDGSFAYASPSYTTVLGYQPHQLIDTSVFDLVHPDDLERVQMAFAEAIQNRTGRAELRVRHADGHYVWIDAVGKVYVDETKEPVGIIASMRDITDRKGSEEKLRQSQKMEAIGSLASGIAHDFNNMLTAILGYTEEAMEHLDPGSPVRADLEEVQRAGQSAASLTRQLLIFSRKSIVHPELLQLGSIVEHLEKILRRVVGEDVELTTRLAPNVGWVKGDRGQLEQVLMNLVVNSRDAMTTGGALLISTGVAQVDAEEAAATSVPAGTYETLTVKDSGCGMTPEVQARIFDPFFTTKGPEKGTGLGLATSRGIVQQAGGHITLITAPGLGTAFTVWLPQATERPLTTAPAEDGVAPPIGHETVLFVEDNDSIRALATRALRRYGYTVLVARHGAEALEIADRQIDNVHLLLTDIVMPGIDGRVLAERLRRVRPDLKVLYASGYTDDSATLRDIRATSVEFIQKPYTPDSLARKIRSVLDSAA